MKLVFWKVAFEKIFGGKNLPSGTGELALGTGELASGTGEINSGELYEIWIW